MGEVPNKRIRNIALVGLVPVLATFLLIGGQIYSATIARYGWDNLAWDNILFALIGGSLAVALVYALLAAISVAIANMAERKGRSWSTFFVLSLFFPVITWIIAAVISTDQATATAGTKKCPKCAELVKVEATLCKHCGSDLS